jgi:sporulation protein YlmC with PRC-barrel domain
MPKRTNKFQQLVAFIERELAGAGVKVTESVELEEYADSSDREVDILIEAELNGHPVRMALECRDRSRPQDKEWIDSLIGKFRDLKIDRVIAISSSGFTRGALQKASQVNIGTLSLQEASQADWPSEFIRTFSKFLVKSYQGISAHFEYRGDRKPQSIGDAFKKAVIVSGDGSVDGTVEEVVMRLYQQDTTTAINLVIDTEVLEIMRKGKDEERDFHVPYNVTDRLLVDMDGSKFPIVSITLTVRIRLQLVPADDRHYLYNRTPITISSIDVDPDEALSIATVQFPGAADPTFKLAYVSRERKSGPKRKNSRDCR